MAFQFPASPVLGQIFEPTPGTSYKWNGTGWSPYSTLFPGGATFTGPVLLQDGTLAAPGLAWVNDKDTGWFRGSGSTVHLGINGAEIFTAGSSFITSSKPHYFADGTQANPGISWASEPGLGFFREGTSVVQFVAANQRIIGWNSSGFYSYKQSNFMGPSVFSSTVTGITAAMVGLGNLVNIKQLENATPSHGIQAGWDDATGHLHLTVDAVAKGWEWPIRASQVQTVNGATSGLITGPTMIEATYDGDTWYQAPLALHGNGGLPGIGLYNSAQGTRTNIMLYNELRFGNSNGGGPTPLGGYAMFVPASGAIQARSFNVTTFAATDSVPMTEALSDLVKLRGVRCFNTETQKPDIRLEVDELELAFPELVNAVEAGKSINYMALAAPIVEAIRELNDRTYELDARTRSPLGSAPASDVNQLTGALSRVLKLRGVRFQNLDTGQSDIRLDDLALEYPELATSDSRLTAPIVEALREINDRLTALERQ